MVCPIGHGFSNQLSLISHSHGHTVRIFAGMSKTITKETIDRIHAIFMHLQLVDERGVQKYDPEEEYRQWIVIAKGLTYSHEANEVYCYSAKLTPWHKRIWQKRLKEIPHQAFVEFVPEAQLWRLGFRI